MAQAEVLRLLLSTILYINASLVPESGMAAAWTARIGILGLPACRLRQRGQGLLFLDS